MSGLYRFLQAFGVAALLACLHLAWGATPWGGEEWSRARLLYAGTGMVSALTLIAIGALGVAARDARARLARIEAVLEELRAARR